MTRKEYRKLRDGKLESGKVVEFHSKMSEAAEKYMTGRRYSQLARTGSKIFLSNVLYELVERIFADEPREDEPPYKKIVGNIV